MAAPNERLDLEALQHNQGSDFLACDATAFEGAAYKQWDDLLDGIFCAYLAYYFWNHGEEDYRAHRRLSCATEVPSRLRRRGPRGLRVILGAAQPNLEPSWATVHRQRLHNRDPYPKEMRRAEENKRRTGLPPNLSRAFTPSLTF